MADTLDSAVDPALLAEAKRLGIDVAQEIEIRLRERVAKRKREIAWQEDNRDAIDSYNRHIERDGIFGSEWRRF